MINNLLKKSFILYICLTLVEYGLVLFGGSLLKFYGYTIIFIWLFFGDSKVPNIRKRKQLLYLGFYLLLILISLLWSTDVDMGTYYLLSMINMVILISIASTLPWNKKDVNQLLFAFQISSAIFSILLISNKQLYYGFLRSTLMINGQAEDPNNLSAMLVIPVLVSIWKILNKNYVTIIKRRYGIFNYLFMGLGIIAMLMVGSRGGLFALICGALFLLFFNNRFSQNHKINANKLYLIKTVAIIAAVLYFIVPYIDQEIFHRLTIERIKEDKGSDRLVIWTIAFKQFLTSPMFGIGLGSFQGTTKLGVHNQFIIVLVESGISGFILFITFLSIMFRKTIKSKSSLLTAILIGTIVVIFFLDAYNKKFFWNAILISMIILKMEKNNRKFLLQNKSLLQNNRASTLQLIGK